MGKFPFKYDPSDRKAIASESLVPMRSEPQESSEMISQLTWGEPVDIIETSETWLHVQSIVDGYIGWVSNKMVDKLSPTEFNILKNAYLTITNTECRCLIGKFKLEYFLPAGSFIYETGQDGLFFHPTAGSITFSSKDTLLKPVDITTTTKGFINAPYLWGGKTIFGIDCSGFTQMAYRILEIYIPRDASQQAAIGQTVNFITEVKPGDLAFFDNEEGLITHVGIILPENKIIHASGKVRMDSIDHQGIFNIKKGIYTHKLRIIKRLSNV